MRYLALDVTSALITAYHPLIIEAHFAVLLNLLLLGKYSDLIGHHHRVTRLMDCEWMCLSAILLSHRLTESLRPHQTLKAIPSSYLLEVSVNHSTPRC